MTNDQTPTAPIPHNAHRRLAAEIYADAEDKRLGVWVPSFQAFPGKEAAAAAFIESRAQLLADKRLAPDTLPPADEDDEKALALHRAVLETTADLLEPGASVSHDEIGATAWNRITPEERRASMPGLLACYTSRVLDEERERAHQEAADNPEDTCLDPHDEASLWDSAADGEGEEATVDRQALINVLSELDLLRRRAAAPAPDAA